MQYFYQVKILKFKFKQFKNLESVQELNEMGQAGWTLKHIEKLKGLKGFLHPNMHICVFEKNQAQLI